MKEFHLTVVMLIALVVRILLFGATMGDAVFATALCGLYGWHLWLESKAAKPVNKEIMDRIYFLEESLAATKDKVNSIMVATHFKR